MKKLIASVIAGISVLALTLIAVLLPPETFLKPRWRELSAALGLCVILSLILQAIWTKQDEDAEKEEREKLYGEVRKVLKKTARRVATRRKKATLTPADKAREEAIKKAERLLDFLTSTEPERQKTTYHLQETLGGGIELTKDASWQKLRSLAIDQLGEELSKALDEGE